MSTVERDTLRVGTLVAAAYRVVRPLAEGGMGVIYEVEQVATGARRALKVMHGQFAGDDQHRARFVREARLTASVPTDHVAQILDAGLDPATGLLFMVMELLEGMTLSQRMRRQDAFEWSDALTVLGQVAHALRAAHALGIVHRDLKPANVFLAQSRHATVPFMVKLLDFGIAKALAAAADVSAVGLGTPSWMAPEQTAVDEHVGPQADVWAFGLLAYLALTGRHYFAGANAASVATAAILREVLLDPLPPASRRAAEVGFADRLPQGFDEWFARCVERDPSKRFPEAGAAFDALASLPAPTPIYTPSSSLARVRAASALRVKTPITAIETPHPSRVNVLRGPSSVASASPPPATGNATADTPRAPRSWIAWTAAVVTGVVIAGSIASNRSRDVQRAGAITPPPAPILPPPRVVLRVHGSNTMGVELVPALAEAFLRRSTGAPAVVRKRTAPDEISVEARDADRGVESIEVFAHGSKTAFEDLLSGTCDLGMASRRVHDEEMSRGPALRNAASAADEHVIGLDGIAVIVNPSNPVSSLTKARIREAFDGDVRRWSDVGGEDRPIVVHARDDRSGTYDTFRLLVLEDRPLAPGAIRQESSEELSDAVAAERGAVGFIGLPYVRSAKAIMVQDSTSVPMLPSPMSVATEDYPLARRLYLYAPEGASSTARDFVDFALSDDGQKIVRAAGFVDLQPKCDAPAAACPGCTREYTDAVRGACRMSVDFRFDVGLNLDTRALRDLNRVVALLGRPEYAGRGLVLLGFSDGQVARAEGLRLSQQRASVVAQQLRARGLSVVVERGMGSVMPVGDDGSEEGRERNRRVEAWLR
jgi:phosphate transport system substrate-binding protein